MFPFGDMIMMLIRTFFYFLFNPLFWLVMVIVYFQYRRTARMEERLFGKPLNNIWEQVAKSLLLGCGGGFLASIVLLVLGLSLDSIGIEYIWPVAILLLLINPRFLCFAYAGGIVSVGVLIADFITRHFGLLTDNAFISSLLEINLTGLLILVGVLHLVESLLIYIGGHWGNSPVYFKAPSGRVVGGFSLQRFWPVPLVGMVASLQPETSELMSSSIQMPDWWPILSAGIEPGMAETLLFLLIPVMAGLGYADLTISSTPREKSIVSGRLLGIYSVALMAMALAAEFFPAFIIPACLFAPLGHELVVFLGHRLEFFRTARFSLPERGTMVLAVYPGSEASRAGLLTEDIIEEVNGERVEDSRHLIRLIDESYFLVHLTVRRESRIITVILKKDRAEGVRPGRASPRWGLIPVPDTRTAVFMEIRKPKLMQKIRKFFSRKRE